MVHSRDVVAGVELAFFIPTALLSVTVCACHGFHRSSGWIYTLILCIVRITGAVCQFVSHTDHSSGLIKTAIIIDSIGLSPLLLATLGLLSRLVDNINSKTVATFTVKHFRLLQLLITVGLILSIAGGTSGNTQPNGTVHVGTESKVGIMLYIVAYVALIFVYAVSVRRTYVVTGKERRVAVAIVLALPFILVRLVYSVCAVFLHSHLFNIVTGNVAVLFIMAVAMEFIVVAMYVLLGFVVDKVDSDNQGPIARRAWKNKKTNRRTIQSGRGSANDDLEAQQQEAGVYHSPAALSAGGRH